MIRNYLTLVARNLRKHAGYSFITVSGLAVGLACSLFIFLFVRLETGFDRFQTESYLIVRITTEVMPPSGPIQTETRELIAGKLHDQN